MNTTAAKRWAIIADDLTGAADAAAAYGPTHSSSVILDLDSSWPDADILSVNTESRYLSAEDAAAAVTAAAARAMEQDRQVFKKIDSLLRGNVGAEVAAALAAVSGGGRGLALVAPAFPGTGRTTVGGVVHVNGARNAQGRFDGDVAAALAAGGLSAELVVRDSGRTPEDLAAHLRDIRDRGTDAVVLDAVSDDDLKRVATAAALLDFPTLLVGSGGLAGHIAAREEGRDVLREHARHVKRTLTVIGSYSGLAREQTEALVAAGAEHITLDHQALEDPAVARKVAAAMLRADVVLTPDPMGAVDKAQALVVAEALARATAAGIGNCEALVLTGGETATAVLKALGAGSFTVLGEVEPGVVMSLLPEPLPLLVTKAGAFGDAGTLARTTQFFSSTTTEMSTK